ncbi:serine/threonine-protein phosphatase 4 regulatory subunit 2-like [Rhopilema esculentum]|uniref:serine/threonine-protein phosphatase 4 regulatory subunit 2-like n=1 Tax=Rhopilema esculentum TaxID=499914 RepID=UPI0031D1E5C8
MENDVDKRLEALFGFIKQEKKVVTQELREIIRGIAKNGRYIYQWEYLKPLYAHELEQVMDHFIENFPPKSASGVDIDKVNELKNERSSILKIFNNFSSAPFTIQRVSELLIQPRKHYKTCAKFLRGLNKNLSVVSTVDPEESETSTVDPIDSDHDDIPPKKIKLDNEEESRPDNGNCSPNEEKMSMTNGISEERKLDAVTEQTLPPHDQLPEVVEGLASQGDAKSENSPTETVPDMNPPAQTYDQEQGTTCITKSSSEESYETGQTDINTGDNTEQKSESKTNVTVPDTPL